MAILSKSPLHIFLVSPPASFLDDPGRAIMGLGFRVEVGLKKNTNFFNLHNDS